MMIMSAIEDLLSEIEEREGRLREEIRNSELKLGMTAVSEREVLGLRVGAKLLSDAMNVSSALSDAEEEARASRTFLAEVQKDEDELDTLLDAAKDRESEIRHLSIRLGAIIYEQCSFALLDKEAYRVVYDDVDADKKLESKDSDSLFSRILGSGKAKVRKMGEEGRFISYAEIAMKSGVALEGENANDILGKLLALKAESGKSDEQRRVLNEKLAVEREKARSIERGLEVADAKIKELQKNEEDALVSYGSYLYDKGSEWIDKDTPSSILDILEEMLGLHREYDSVLSEKERLEREAKADDYRALIESEEGKIMVLEKEKERIDREILEIRKEIDMLRNRIERLKGDV